MNHSPSRLCSIYRALAVGAVVWATFGLFSTVVRAESVTISINNESGLRNAIADINKGNYSQYEKVEFKITADFIKLTGDLEEIKVPGESKTAFTFTSEGKTINGDGHQGFVITTNADSPISFENLQMSNCVAQGETGEDGKVSGGGGGSGLGGAIHVKSGNVSLVDVKFTNNNATGGTGGKFSPATSTTSDYGKGGDPTGGKGRASSGGTDAGFGGGGGGSPAADNVGKGGLGAGDGGTQTINDTKGGTGGGGLGAGGAVFVEPGASLSVQYSDDFNSATGFSGNSAAGGKGGTGAEDGEGIGNALFAGGNITFNTENSSGGDPKKITIGKTQSIGGPAGATDFADYKGYSKEKLAEIKKYAGGVSVVGGGTLVMQSENTYLGKTEVDGSKLVVENGKAIHDQAEVGLKNGGVLELQSSETIGYLSGTADSEVHLYHTNDDGKKIGSKTLTIGGDEYASEDADDDSDVKAGNGKTILGDTITAFNGKIITDHDRTTQEHVVKTGTGLLILGGDNTNTYTTTVEKTVKDEEGNSKTVLEEQTYQDDFTTELRNGTIQLNHDKALGGGVLTVTSTDKELDRNMLQTGVESLKVDNTIKISTTTPFRVGAASELASNKNVKLDLAGQITGGSIMMNMANRDQVLTLSNLGVENATTLAGKTTYSRSQTNQLTQVQLNRGTLALTGEKTTDSDKWTTGLGSATIVALMGSGEDASLRVDTQGLVVDNAITINSSGLTITNGEGVSDFTLTGRISGAGGLKIDLNNKSDTVNFSGDLIRTGAVYEGVTDIKKGTLKLDKAAEKADKTLETIRFSGGLALAEDAVLDLNGNTVSFSGKGDYDLNGTVKDEAGTGSLVKAGTGAWNLNLQETMNKLTVDAGSANLKNERSVDNVVLGKAGTLKLDTDARLQTLKGSTGSKLDVNNHELTLKGTGEIFYGELIGGSGSTIVLEKGTLPEGKTINWDLYGASKSWTGTIDVREGAVLRASGAGTLGKFEKTEESSEVGSVILNDSTLSVNTYDGYPVSLGRLVIANNNEGTGYGTVDTITSYDSMFLYDVEGTGDLIKTGKGNLHLRGENKQFSGDVQLDNGIIFLEENAALGSGKLITSGSDENQRGLVVEANKDAQTRTITNGMSLGQDLTINYSDAAKLILSGKVDGNARLNLQGGGSILLDGNYDAYTGEISLATGTTMQLGSTAGAGNVNLLQSTVTVYSGALLDASGTVNKIQVAYGGNLKLSSETSKLRITEELYLTSGSVLNVDCIGTVSGATEKSGLITIGSDAKAVINGGIVVVNGTDVQVGDWFTLIDTEDGGDIQVNGLLAFRDNVDGARVVGMYDEVNKQYLYKFAAFDYLDGMKTKNQLTLGNYLNYVVDNAVMTPELNEFLNELESVVGEDAAAGQLLYDELSGQVFASMGTAQIQGTSLLNQSLAGQLRPGAYAGRTWDGSGGDDGDHYRGQAYADRGLSGWMSGYGMIGSVDPDKHGAGYDLDIYGGIIGLERCSNNLSRRLGFYYGYGQTKLDTNSTLGQGTSDDNRLGLYIKWDDRLGYGLITGGVGFNSYKFDRVVSIPTPTSLHKSVSGVQTNFYAERGTSLRGALGTLQPFIGIQYIYQHQDGFTEQFPGLVTNGVFTNSLRTMLGGRFIKGFGGYHRELQWYVQGHWMHEYLDQYSTMTASMLVPGSFEVIGTGLGRDWIVAGTGLQWNYNARVSLNGSYDAQFNDRTALHIGSIGAKIVW